MPNRVARLLAVLAVQPRYLPSKIPFVRRRDFCATNIRRGEERASAEASALEVSGKGQCDADNMDETDDLTRRQDASQYNHAEDARPDLRGISASARRMSALGHERTYRQVRAMSAFSPDSGRS